jgi:hypothetical protein
MPEKKFISYRDESRKNYGENREEGNDSLCRDQLRLGAEFRTADALEEIAKTLKNLVAPELCSIRYQLQTIAGQPSKEKREIGRLKRIVKQQKAEIAQLKGAA